MFKLFIGMEDAERGFFGGMKNEGHDIRLNENEGNDQTDVTFGFPILDDT